MIYLEFHVWGYRSSIIVELHACTFKEKMDPNYVKILFRL